MPPRALARPRLARALAGPRRLLTWKRATLYGLVLGGLYCVAWAFSLAGAQPPLNGSGVPIGGDYIAAYTAGRLVLAGRAPALYDHDVVMATQQRLLDGRAPDFYDAFRNPPFFALLFAPLAVLDLLPSVLLWTVLSVDCLVAAVWLVLAERPDLRPRWRGLAVLIFAFAPVYFGLIDGQNATLSLLLYVLLYRALLHDQPARAGLWAALGLFKPQLFVVFPLVFLLTRRWRALAVFVGVGGLLALVSLLLVGPDGLLGWLRSLLETEPGNASRNAWRMHSLKGLTDGLLPSSPTLSLGAYAVLALPLLVALVRAWWQAGHAPPSPTLWAFSCLVAVLVDPHLVDYDLTVLVAAGLLVAGRLPGLRWLILLLYPLLLFRAQLPLGESAVQLSTLVLVAMTGLVWRNLRVREPQPQVALAPARVAC